MMSPLPSITMIATKFETLNRVGYEALTSYGFLLNAGMSAVSLLAYLLLWSGILLVLFFQCKCGFKPAEKAQPTAPVEAPSEIQE